jgi:hypothetical protein
MRFETWPMTLSRFPNTLLGNANKRRKYFDPINNEYFFERHRQSFESILHYYQSNGRFLIRPFSVSSEVFFDEIVFFQLGKHAISKYKKDEGYTVSDRDGVLEKNLPKNHIKRIIWMLFECPSSSIYARIVAIISVLAVITSITLFCIETLPDVRMKRHRVALAELATSIPTTTPTTTSTFSSTSTSNEDTTLTISINKNNINDFEFFDSNTMSEVPIIKT